MGQLDEMIEEIRMLMSRSVTKAVSKEKMNIKKLARATWEMRQ